MKRPILNEGTAHVLVEVSKAPEEMGHEKLNHLCNLEGRAMRYQLQAEGKTVLRTYKIIAGVDVKVLCDWVILGTKNTKEHRRAVRAQSVKVPQPGPSPIQNDSGDPVSKV